MVAIPQNITGNIGTKLWTHFRKAASAVKADALVKAAPDFYTPVANTLGQRVKQALQAHGLPHNLPADVAVYQSKIAANQPKLFARNDRGALAAKNLSQLFKTGKMTEVRVLEFDTPAAMQAKLAELVKKKGVVAGANNSISRIGGTKDTLYSALHYVPLDDRRLVRVMHAETGPKMTELKNLINEGVSRVKAIINGLFKTTADTTGALFNGLKQTATTTINPAKAAPKA